MTWLHNTPIQYPFNSSEQPIAEELDQNIAWWWHFTTTLRTTLQSLANGTRHCRNVKRIWYLFCFKRGGGGFNEGLSWQTSIKNELNMQYSLHLVCSIPAKDVFSVSCYDNRKLASHRHQWHLNCLRSLMPNKASQFIFCFLFFFNYTQWFIISSLQINYKSSTSIPFNIPQSLGTHQPYLGYTTWYIIYMRQNKMRC